jgi:hypothetical protein
MVTVRSLVTPASVSNVPMLMDSGADVSLLPREILAAILGDTSGVPQYELEAFDGTKSMAQSVQLELEFLGKKFRGQFLLIDGRVGILGRNILNLLSLYLDGPALTWTESKSP